MLLKSVVLCIRTHIILWLAPEGKLLVPDYQSSISCIHCIKSVGTETLTTAGPLLRLLEEHSWVAFSEKGLVMWSSDASAGGARNQSECSQNLTSSQVQLIDLTNPFLQQ